MSNKNDWHDSPYWLVLIDVLLAVAVTLALGYCGSIFIGLFQ